MAHIGVLENITPQTMIPELEHIVSYYSDIMPCKGQLLLLRKDETYEILQVIINTKTQRGPSAHTELDILVVCQKCNSGLNDIAKFLIV